MVFTDSPQLRFLPFSLSLLPPHRFPHLLPGKTLAFVQCSRCQPLSRTGAETDCCPVVSLIRHHVVGLAQAPEMPPYSSQVNR